MNAMKPKLIKMPEEMFSALEAESRRTGAPQSEIIRRAISAYLFPRNGRRSDQHSADGESHGTLS
jgi:metal-responsive CopG/Arc/MetJ family transcriptional regulator